MTKGNGKRSIPHEWVSVDYTLQHQAPFIIDVRVKRGDETFEKTLDASDDKTWPLAMYGLRFEDLQQERVADGILDAMGMGLNRTVRSVRMIYQGLYAIMFGRISVKMMSGPITMAQASYFLAGQGCLATPPLDGPHQHQPRRSEFPTDPGPRRRPHGLPHLRSDPRQTGPRMGASLGIVHRPSDDRLPDAVCDRVGYLANIFRVKS